MIIAHISPQVLDWKIEIKTQRREILPISVCESECQQTSIHCFDTIIARSIFLVIVVNQLRLLPAACRTVDFAAGSTMMPTARDGESIGAFHTGRCLVVVDPFGSNGAEFLVVLAQLRPFLFDTNEFFVDGR